MKRLDFYCKRVMWTNSIDVHLRQQVAHDRFAVARNITFEPLEEGNSNGEPVLSLTLEQALQLMDELWHAGVRPSEGHGSVGQLAATQSHLKDMQRFAYSLLSRDLNDAALSFLAQPEAPRR